jgi:hypothetical protein
MLKPGETWTGTMNITGIPRYKPGTASSPGQIPQFAFTVTADPVKGVTETDETNNTRNGWAPDPCYGK